MKKLIIFVLIALCLFYMPASAYAATESYKIAEFKEFTMIEGESIKLTLSSKYKDVTWSSSDKDIATISKKGTLTAKAEGKTTITAKSGKKKFKSVVFVYEDYSDWIVIDTNMYDLVRDGMLSGAIAYYEEDYYFVSPDYYADVLEPKIDAMKEDIDNVNDKFIDEYIPSDHILTPDAEFIIEDDNAEKAEEDRDLQKRINELRQSGKSNSE